MEKIELGIGVLALQSLNRIFWILAKFFPGNGRTEQGKVYDCDQKVLNAR
jgi:hypothetical protein